MLHDRFLRRALGRAALGAALGALVPGHRRGAALAGAAAGAAIERPVAGAPLALAAVAARDPVGAVAGAALGALTTRVWPTAPRTAAELRRHNTTVAVDPCTDGAGVVIVVNLGAGSAASSATAATIAERLPAAEIVEPGEDDDVGEALAKAAARATVALGAAGGDGTLSAAAALAHDRGLPLLALPAGTLNHFARDLGLLTIDDAIDALQTGQAVAVDLAAAGDAAFVNTASFGAYTDLVEARERLEARVEKWPAMAVALVQVLRRAEPVEVTVDGHRRRLWLGFIGNGRYHPSGFAPTWREVLNDGRLDIRLVDAARPLARLRLLLAVLTGRLGRCTVYEQRVAPQLELVADADLPIALDGELRRLPTRVSLSKRAPVLLVHAPHR
ncbi:MAG TPA: diacylglycerol kinase family protein [Acidimicrobiales bacterium]|nr:diacylglycerol kinase family protein [Acidimicrobiales bacterium]